MNKLVMMVLVMVAACSSSKQKVHLIDSGVDAPGACNLLTQTGCPVGDKCTWFHDDASSPPIGHIGCAPNGTGAVKANCMFGAPGVTGYDDCMAGLICMGHRDANGSALPGTCETICDAQAGSGCGSNEGCVRTSGLFAAPGTMDPAQPGTCVTGCDPTVDNDYDGSGSAYSKRASSPCGDDPTIGCYGEPSSINHKTFFFCARPAQQTGTTPWTTANLVHRDIIPSTEVFLNSCHPGYTIAKTYDSATTTNMDCYAFCKPGNSFGSPGTGSATVPNPQLPNGQVGAACRPASGGREGTFGPIPNGTAASNGEHCIYSWYFEYDSTSQTINVSGTSNTVGICYDHTQYTYDPTGGSNATDVLPPCASLPLIGSAGTFDARSFGCIDTVTAGFTTAAAGKANVPESFKRGLDVTVPALDPRYGGAAMRSPE